MIKRLSFVVLSLLAASCSSAAPEEPSNPGLDFSGTYHVELTQQSRNGEPVDAGEADTEEFDWIVQPICEGATGPCTAIAESPEPDEVSDLNRERTDLIFEGGNWTRVERSAESIVCNNRETGERIDEPFFGLDSTRLSADDNDSPTTTLTGTRTSAISGTCAGVDVYSITATRTGEVPDGTATPTDVDPVTTVVESRGADFRGTYTATAQSTTDLTRVFPSADYKVKTVACTRDGAECAVSVGQGDVVDSVLVYADEKFGTSIIGTAEMPCPAGVGRFPRVTEVLDSLSSDTPMSAVIGTETVEFTGQCGGTSVNRLSYTRVGD